MTQANARRALSTAPKRKGPVKSVVRKSRGRTYTYDTLKLLVSVGRLFTDHHAFLTQLYLDEIDAHTRTIDALTLRIEAAIKPFASAR